MVKILAIGDFHGKLSSALVSKIKRMKPDIILSPGDFCGDKEYSRLFFKYVYDKDEDTIPLSISKRLERAEQRALKSGLSLIKKLKKLKIPIFSVHGNWDPSLLGPDIGLELHEKDILDAKKLAKLQNKKFRFIDLDCLEISSAILVGGTSSTSPRRLKKDMAKRLVKRQSMDPKEAEELIRLIKRDWDFRQKKYERAFNKAIKLKQKTKKPIIFLTHNCPYNTKLDKIKTGSQKGKHYGSYQERLITKKYKPDLVLCGHMHENFGKDKIGKTKIFNCGSALDGKFVLLDL